MKEFNYQAYLVLREQLTAFLEEQFTKSVENNCLDWGLEAKIKAIRKKILSLFDFSYEYGDESFC